MDVTLSTIEANKTALLVTTQGDIAQVRDSQDVFTIARWRSHAYDEFFIVGKEHTYLVIFTQVSDQVGRELAVFIASKFHQQEFLKEL